MSSRSFKLVGQPVWANTSASVSINGVEVFNGLITGTLGEVEQVIATGSANISGYTGGNAVISVSIVVNSGFVRVGMFGWNGNHQPNPAYTPEQIALWIDPATPNTTLVSMAESVANPPLSADEITTLSSTNPALDNIKNDILVAHLATPFVYDLSVYANGLSPSADQENRFNMAIDGVPTTPELGGTIDGMNGSVITFDAYVFEVGTPTIN